MTLKGIILSTDKVLFDRKYPDQWTEEVIRLVKFAKLRGLTPIVLGNREFRTRDGRTAEEVFNQEWGDVKWFIAERNDGTPYKQRSETLPYILGEMGWRVNEALLIGSDDDDMRTAVNGGMLFLNATWYGQASDYGLLFNTPSDIARFLDTCCLREHYWHYAIQKDDLEVYALAPYSTYKPEYGVYSADARDAAKTGAGHPDFWTSYFVATMYLSGIYQRIDYAAPFPNSTIGTGMSVMEAPMLAFTKCFRKTYLRDLIVRHTASEKSATSRAAGKGYLINHQNQLNTIVLEQFPLRGTGTKRYKNCPVTHGKAVLVIDDICTNGYAFEAARAYITQTGAITICVSWLKTINSEYQQLADIRKFNPFEHNSFDSTNIGRIVRYEYSRYIADASAPVELSHKLSSYIHWAWPTRL